jgi:hypothetical protein
MRYVAADYDKHPISTEEAMLDFCKEPRTKSNIRLHFCLSHYQATEFTKRLVQQDKLVCADDKPWNDRNKKLKTKS